VGVNKIFLERLNIFGKILTLIFMTALPVVGAALLIALGMFWLPLIEYSWEYWF